MYDCFISSITLKEKRYEVSLPWHECRELLPDSEELSLEKLQGLLQLLKETLVVLKEYAITFDQLSKGIEDKINLTDSSLTSPCSNLSRQEDNKGEGHSYMMPLHMIKWAIVELMLVQKVHQGFECFQ